MSWQIQESIHLGYSDPFWTISNSYDVVARPNFSFLQHAKVEPWSVMCYEQGGHPRFIHANADAVARYARLCHFKRRITNVVSITNADLVISKSLNSEVLAELAKTKIIAAKEVFPVMVGIHLVDEYGALLPSVTGKIRLRVTINIEPAYHPPPLGRKFPNRGSDRLAIPTHFAWKA